MSAKTRHRQHAKAPQSCTYCKEADGMVYSDLERRWWCFKCDLPLNRARLHIEGPLADLIYDPERDGVLPTIEELSKERQGRRPRSGRRGPVRRRNPLGFMLVGPALTLTMFRYGRLRTLAVTWPEWDEVVADVEQARGGGVEQRGSAGEHRRVDLL